MLTGVDLTFMGVRRSNSGLFSTPFFLSHLWEKEKKGGGEKKEEEGKEGKRE